MTLAPATTAAGEIEPVKFICNSTGGVVEIVARADDLVVGLSPLPGGCAWLPATTHGRIGETLFLAEAPGNRVARITRVFLIGREGYSAGLVELLSYSAPESAPPPAKVFGS